MQRWSKPILTLALCALTLSSTAQARPEHLSQVGDVAAGSGGAPADLDDAALADGFMRRFAPTILQETSPDSPEQDRPLPVDFDGDWDARNNWTHLSRREGAAKAVVYASAVLTSTHAYLTYTLFYPRDWMTPACLPYLCHDNDLEVALVVVERGRGVSGRIAYVETKAHKEYRAVRGESVQRDASGRPVIRGESEGHGLYAVQASDGALPDGPQWTLYAAEGAAAVSGGEAMRRRVESYAIVSLRDTLWAERDAEKRALWRDGDGGPLYYQGERHGRLGRPVGTVMTNRRYPGGVRPPWALQPPGTHRGDWFFDPALVAARRHGEWLSTRGSASLVYRSNPFIEDLRGECQSVECAPARVQVASVTGPRTWLGGAALALGLGYGWSSRSRRRGREPARRWSWRRRAR